MILTPFVIIFSEKIANMFLIASKKIGIKIKIGSAENETEIVKNDLENHLVIIGFGLNGSNLAKAAASSNIPFVVVEMNADTVSLQKSIGLPIIFGDATQDHILDTVHIAKARAAVIAISDNNATKTIIRNIRSLSDSLYLVVRTRYVKEIPELIASGADEVIPEEFETSVKIFTHVLRNFLVTENEIDLLEEKVRADNYQIFKGELMLPKSYQSKIFPEFEITSLSINSDNNIITNKPLKELNLRNNYGINILGIKRGNKMLDSILPEEVLKQGDIIYLQGTQSKIDQLYSMIK